MFAAFVCFLGSSRDWAAKGPWILVIRIYCHNEFVML